jgi:hypothetical protein
MNSTSIFFFSKIPPIICFEKVKEKWRKKDGNERERENERGKESPREILGWGAIRCV